MSKQFNVAVIGYGWAATAHIAAINATSNAQVKAVWSSRPLDSNELSAKHGGSVTAYTDLASMLANPDLHVVDITSYPNQHASQFIAAAKAGKHIIIEKPLAIEWSEIGAMKEAVEKSGVKTCVCFECRYSSQFLATKALIDSGVVGDLHYGEIDYYHGIGPWYGQYRWNTKRDLGGSALLTAGCHALDALLLCMGSEVEEVTSYATQSKHPTFAAYEYQTSATTSSAFQWRRRKMRRDRRLLSALLFPHSPRRQRRLDPG
jgi:predicted dehydrogenase